MKALSLLLAVLVPAVLSQGAAQQHPLFQSPSSSSPPSPPSPFRVTSLTRTIELGGAVSRASTVYTIAARSTGDVYSGGETPNGFVFSLDADGEGQLSFMEATTGKTSSSRKGVAVVSLGVNPEGSVRYYAAQLPAGPAAAAGEDVTFTVSTVHNHASVAKPATLPQDAVNQGLFWTGDLLGGATAALVASGDIGSISAGDVKVKVKTPSPRAAEEDVPAGWSVNHPTGSSLFTYTNTASLAAAPESASVYYEQPEPVISVRKLERTLQISHWGYSLAVQDDIELVNDGPKLKGHFSRLTHQAISYMKRSGNSVSPHTLTSLTMILPPNVNSPYFIDEVGNVSTSRFRPSPRQSTKHTTTLNKAKKPTGHSVLELTPRYPLLGGWNYTFSVGYQQSLEDVLHHDTKKGRYVLAVPFLTPLKNVAFDDVTVKIVLPEGASNVALSPPFAMDSINTTTTYTYLDTVGRQTLVLHKRACSEKHGVELFVSYDYSTAKLVRKPIGIATVLAGCFAVAGLLRRMSWSLKTV